MCEMCTFERMKKKCVEMKDKDAVDNSLRVYYCNLICLNFLVMGMISFRSFSNRKGGAVFSEICLESIFYIAVV